ncbi:MAG: FAD-binding oxidoreductase [Xanthobacteraceae bacterium]|nr:FAD-binding oxidoreductase [Xanthobacteraceae bacterium]
MARTDAIVLGAGIVGVSVALHLAKRGLAVALLDRGEPGQGTSYGNAGIIEANTLFPATFPPSLRALIRIALKRAPEADYHVRFLAHVAPWLVAFRRHSSPERLVETMKAMRPLFARAVAEHEALMAESGAGRYMRHTGWLKLYRSDKGLAGTARERAIADELGLPLRLLDVEAARALEPSLAPAFRHAVFWEQAASVSNPLAVTQAYVARFKALGGVALKGDAMRLHQTAGRWRVDTAEGPIDAEAAVVTLGPWAPDLLGPLGIKLPLGVKRGYHRHFRPRGNASLARPILDAENGYCIVPMEQGIRITTGAEFAGRDAAPTPSQFARVLPRASELFPLGEAIEAQPWMGARPCFADSRPVIGKAAGRPGLWLAYGHGHSGLTLGPVTGRLIAEMMTGATPFCDPAPYRAERFGA